MTERFRLEPLMDQKLNVVALVIIRSAPAKFQFLAASKFQSDHSEKAKAQFLSHVVGDPLRKGVEKGPQLSMP